MNIKPVADRILIRPKKVEEVTKTGILLARKNDEKKDEAEVVAKGPEAPDYLVIGCVVIYAKYSAEEVESNGEKLAFIRPDDIFAIIE